MSHTQNSNNHYETTPIFKILVTTSFFPQDPSGRSVQPPRTPVTESLNEFSERTQANDYAEEFLVEYAQAVSFDLKLADKGCLRTEFFHDKVRTSATDGEVEVEVKVVREGEVNVGKGVSMAF